ncbi:rhomboid family intramembrane serine protease [Hymenobacter aerilatus]|uniref:Rhomboid family intramembrane serine protease n=1 Tax=Hymenobacter aerilatus TaxID=2932251 RepID=A0A8T9SS89_9BACT|nr:rhomboid family intramembrane serine protease [Hymenobacter aerilatus]UOR03884.1 rhomboid family intramembrane serine protease [Hymenobacter aerilatus]
MSIFNDIRTAFNRRDNSLNQLLLINGLVFLIIKIVKIILSFSKQPYYGDIIEQLALPANTDLLMYRPWTLLTYAFLHEDFFHILFNLLNLYWFGALIREYLGERKVVSLYILGALAGAALFLIGYNFIPSLQTSRPLLEGASGAVVAIIVGAATLLPNYEFNLILIGPVRIKYIALALVIIFLIGLDGGNTGGQMAHLGGAILGFVFIKQLQAGRDMGRPILAIGDWVGGLFTGRPNLRVSHRNRATVPPTTKARTGTTQPDADDIDSILDKISRSGYESLSKEEKQKLFRASQQ